MTIDQSAEAPAKAAAVSPAPATTRYKVAAAILAVVGVGVIVGTLLALDVLRGYQVVLNAVGALALLGVALLLFRGRNRGWAVVLGWLAAFGVMCEAGDHQTQINDTGALAATNTEYFLPLTLWIAIIVLFLAALAVTMLTKRVRGGS